MICWRISNYVDLSGIGGLRASARWHTAGHPIIYTAESPASAILEILVNLEIDTIDDLPASYTLMKITVPDVLLDAEIEESDLPIDWRENVSISREIGDIWLNGGKGVVLSVPSAIVPFTTNLLINPDHPNIKDVEIVAHGNYPFDERIFKLVSGIDY